MKKKEKQDVQKIVESYYNIKAKERKILTLKIIFYSIIILVFVGFHFLFYQGFLDQKAETWAFLFIPYLSALSTLFLAIVVFLFFLQSDLGGELV